MKLKIALKLASVLIGALSFTLFYSLYTLAFNSIIISHYGGLQLEFYFVSGIILSFVTAFYSRQILVFVIEKSTFKRLLLYFVIASMLCLAYISLIGIINNFAKTGLTDPKIILKVLTSNIYYCLIAALTLQFLFLSKISQVVDQTPNFKYFLIQIVTLPLIAALLYTAFHSRTLLKLHSTIPDSQIVLIPWNLESTHVRIFYGESGAKYLPTENDSLLFEIPKNGILIVQNKMAPNTNGRTYYSVTENGKRTRINKSSYHIVNGYNTRDGGNNYQIEFSPENGILAPENAHYENFYVDLENVNEDLFFENYLLDENLMETDKYYYHREDLLREFRFSEERKFDSLSVLFLNEIREANN